MVELKETITDKNSYHRMRAYSVSGTFLNGVCAASCFIFTTNL